jgi:hypothetical protein
MKNIFVGDKSPPLRGRATLQAVTRVKPEQASKVKLWMPTRLYRRPYPWVPRDIDATTSEFHERAGHHQIGPTPPRN